MKKRILVSTILVIIISCYLVGCSQSEKPDNSLLNLKTENKDSESSLGDVEILDMDDPIFIDEDLLKALDDLHNDDTEETKETEEIAETSESSYEYINNNTIKRDDIYPLYDWYTDRSFIESDRIKSDMKPSEDYGTDSDELIFTEEICGHIMSVSYEFDSDNKLISITAHFVENVSDTQYAMCFGDLYMKCEKEYGTCTTSEPNDLRSILDDPDAYAKAATASTSVMAQWGKEYTEEQTINLLYTRTISVDYADVIFMYACPNYAF